MRELASLVFLLALVGCDDGRTTPPDPDASSPPGADGSTPQTDGGSPPPTPDSGTPPSDGGTPPPPADGGGGSTAGADPRAGYIGCGGTSCMSPEVCCVSLSGQTCGAASSCTGGFSAAGHCDGREDCSSGEACCVHFEMFDTMNGAFCRSGGCPSGDNELCHSDADCSRAGDTCVACEPPTGGVLDVVYGICSSDGTCPSPYTTAS